MYWIVCVILIDLLDCLCNFDCLKWLFFVLKYLVENCFYYFFYYYQFNNSFFLGEQGYKIILVGIKKGWY